MDLLSDSEEWKKSVEKWFEGVSPKNMKRMKWGAVVGLLLIANPVYNVNPGHRALIFDRRSGLEDKIYPEGTHVKWPFLQRKIIYDVRALPYEIKTTSGSRDLQMVDLAVRVLSRPVVDQLPTIYRTLGRDYSNRVLPSVVDETVKTVVAQYNATQLLSQREKVSSEIREMLKQRAAYFHIELDDVSITSLTFGKEYTAAIEAKQIAAQEAERATYVVKMAEQEKRTAIIQAQGEAKSAQLIGKSMARNPAAFIALRRIEASKEISRVMSNSANMVYLNSDELLLGASPRETEKGRFLGFWRDVGSRQAPLHLKVDADVNVNVKRD